MVRVAGIRTGPYEFLPLLGAGGTSEASAARGTRLERSIPIKVLPKDFPEKLKLRERFKKERIARADAAFAAFLI